MAELLAWQVRAPARGSAAPGLGPSSDPESAALPVDARTMALLQAFVLLAGLASAALGLIGFAGQLTMHPLLSSVRSDWVPMKANTGLMLAASGAALAIVRLKPPWAPAVSRIVGLLMLGVSMITAAEYLFGVDTGLDELVVREPAGAVATVHPGRMAQITAICFGFLAVSMLAGWRKEPSWRPLSSVSALPVFLVSLVAGIGYAFGADEAYSWAGNITAMAAPTSAALILLSAGLVAARIEDSVLRWLVSPSSGGVMLRRLLPVALLSPAVFAWLKVQGLAARVFATPEFGAATVAVATVLVFSAALVWCAALLDGLDARRRAGEVRIARLNEMLMEQVRALEVANRELEGFAYAMGHVLRAPLRALDGFSKLLLDDYGPKLDAEGVRMLGVVRTNAQNMSELIDGIGAFLRLGREPLALARTDMTALAQAAVEALKPKMAGRSVRIALPPLPSVRADAGMLGRVWLQLLDNAVKFTSRRPHAVIEVGAQTGEGEITYFVRDNGVGFDMKYVDRIWGVFNRLHGEEFAGDGMGLAIVQRIVLRHGGRVRAEGKPGQGAAFFFTLPTREAGHA